MEEYQIGQKNEEHLEAFARHVIIQEAFLWKKKKQQQQSQACIWSSISTV